MFSNLSKRVRASAVEPAKPASTWPPRSWRILRALCFITTSPMVTWPSPAIATSCPRRTASTVVACSSPVTRCVMVFGAFLRFAFYVRTPHADVAQAGASTRGAQTPVHTPLARTPRRRSRAPLDYRREAPLGVAVGRAVPLEARLVVVRGRVVLGAAFLPAALVRTVRVVVLPLLAPFACALAVRRVRVPASLEARDCGARWPTTTGAPSSAPRTCAPHFTQAASVRPLPSVSRPPHSGQGTGSGRSHTAKVHVG